MNKLKHGDPNDLALETFFKREPQGQYYCGITINQLTNKCFSKNEHEY